MFEKWYARKLRRPSGILGIFVALRMNEINSAASELCVSCLDLKDDSSVLELGFGGGNTLSALLREAKVQRVSGLEISRSMIFLGVLNFFGQFIKGRLSLKLGDLNTKLPFKDGSFDNVCSLNTVYYWKDPEATLQEVRRVLLPGGVFALEFNPKESFSEISFTEHGFTLYSEDEVASLLRKSGFSQIDFQRGEDIDGGFSVAVAR